MKKQRKAIKCYFYEFKIKILSIDAKIMQNNVDGVFLR